jgi:hypothetical protein
VIFGGERIFLRLGVSIFGCWIGTQVLGAIKICTERKKKLIEETDKGDDEFTTVEVSVKLRHEKG